MSKKTIKVKHIIEYLQQFDLELEVILDKDGWLQEECNLDATPLEIIDNRGLFDYCKYENDEFLSINN